MLDEEDKNDLMEAFDDAYIEIEQCICMLLRDNSDKEQDAWLNRLFRSIHNIKGNAGLLKVEPVVDFAHVVEEVASSLRKRQFDFNQAIAETLLIAMDRLHDIHQKELYNKRFDHLCIDELKTLYHSMSLATQEEINSIAAQTLQFLGAGISDNDDDSFLFTDIKPTDKSPTISPPPEAPKSTATQDLLYFQQTALELDFMEETWGGRSIQLFDWAMKMNDIGGSNIDAQQFSAAIYLHDIGMTFVPNELWRKKLVLNPKEHGAIARHPDWGYEYLVRIPGWEEAARIIHQHHESVDGSGYPQGLTSEETHPGAKILKILDTFFFLTNGSVDPEKRQSTIRAVSAINARTDTEFEGMWVKCFNHMIRSELRAGNI